MIEIKPGEIVTLKSGGIPMTVQSVYLIDETKGGEDGEYREYEGHDIKGIARCIWYHNDEYKEQSFYLVVLTHYVAPEQIAEAN